MRRILIGLLFAGSIVLLSDVSSAAAQEADGTVKIRSRMVSPGIGLSWGDGVLTYQGQDYPFTFQAKGLFRDVDPAIAAAELSGQVFNLRRLEIFSGTYHKVEADASDAGGGTRATMKNGNGVVVNLVSTIEGRKFILGRDGMSILLKRQKP
jgi:outer membrane immunogenic protein